MSDVAQPSAGRGPRLWLMVTLLVGSAYLWGYLDRGWYPHDEGALGQMAERVLGGEVPHRDFDDPYTGLLNYVHAAAFRIGGVRLPVLRIPLFAAAVLALAACFRIAVRMVPPVAAAGVALVSLAWSVPNYPASLPSWYNLFFALFGVLALLRWDESRATRWLFLAGLMGGLSFLIKLSGLFYVAGAALFLLFATWARGETPASPKAARWVAPAAISLGLAGLVMLLWRSVAPYHLTRVIYHFVAPGALLAAALAAREWSAASESDKERLLSLARAGAPFALGVMIPIGVFVALFALAEAAPALWNGVFVAPFRRLAFANLQPPAPFWMLAAAPLIILLRPRQDWAAARWRWVALPVAALLAAVLWLSYRDSFPHRFVWQSLRSLVPMLAAVGAAIIVLPKLAARWAPGRERRFVLLACVTACASLIQFPFSSPIYFLYVAPLLILSLVALVEGVGRTPRALSGVTLAFYGGFAVLLVTPGASVGIGYRYEPSHETERLELPRGGLRVPPADARLYATLIPRLQTLAAGGAVWAGPDAPEVYFLGGFRNRTRAVFDFLNPDNLDPNRLIRIMQSADLRAVVINLQPSFTPPIAAAAMEEVRRRFPLEARIGRFELRWAR